jgi:hypothetical protein
MKLIDYLNQLSWSQADLARHAKVSNSSVHRALKGDKLSRRVAAAIQETIATNIKQAELRPVISDLKVVPVKRKKAPAPAEPPAKQERGKNTRQTEG